MSAVEHNPALLPPGLAPVGRPAAAPSATPAPGAPSFASVLGATQQPVKFSSHALQRVERRGIDVSPATLGRLNDGVERAAG